MQFYWKSRYSYFLSRLRSLSLSRDLSPPVRTFLFVIFVMIIGSFLIMEFISVVRVFSLRTTSSIRASWTTSLFFFSISTLRLTVGIYTFFLLQNFSFRNWRSFWCWRIFLDTRIHKSFYYWWFRTTTFLKNSQCIFIKLLWIFGDFVLLNVVYSQGSSTDLNRKTNFVIITKNYNFNLFTLMLFKLSTARIVDLWSS